ncbi:MAG: hypothetical protein HWN66_03825 [Candidatus Helarchaeota archaeon]|nr:hypothetical protein [Candidatus Helarchaeota archaeon]
MALWLGKVGIEEEDLSKFFRERKKLMEYYLNEMKFRVTLKLTLKELKKFEQAIIQEYGTFTALNSRKAAHAALEKWIQETLSK